MGNSYEEFFMFISSFSTYATNNTSNRAAKTAANEKETKATSFSDKLTKNISHPSLVKQNISINYISQGKAQHNKQMIEISQKNIQNSKKDDFKTTNNIKNSFTSNASLQSAKVAYTSNAIMFPLLKKPTATINQTPTISKALPQDIQELKEKNMRHIMVNTYLANDNYYKITA